MMVCRLAAAMTERRNREGLAVATRVELRFENIRVACDLDDTPCASALVERLPLALSFCGTGVALCAQLPFALPVKACEARCGWRNGDVGFKPQGTWLTVCLDDEENSARYGSHVVVGHVATLGDLAKLRGLVGTHNAQLVCAAPHGEKNERVQEGES